MTKWTLPDGVWFVYIQFSLMGRDNQQKTILTFGLIERSGSFVADDGCDRTVLHKISNDTGLNRWLHDDCCFVSAGVLRYTVLQGQHRRGSDQLCERFCCRHLHHADHLRVLCRDLEIIYFNFMPHIMDSYGNERRGS